MSDCESLEALRKVIHRLTSETGCPWDKAQTPLSLADYIIEESHELVAAIRSGDAAETRGELGDLLFLLLFVADYYEKNAAFSLADAFDESAAKMIRRHPHVFGDETFANLDEQLKAWERIKKEERGAKGSNTGLFAGLPESLPPLVKSYRIHSKAARAGFTWDDDEDVEKQVESEWLELLDAMQNGDLEAQKRELGDIIFSLVELGRRKGIRASEALDLTDRKFLRRFARMEELAASRGREFSALSLDEKDELWNEAKAGETTADDNA